MELDDISFDIIDESSKEGYRIPESGLLRPPKANKYLPYQLTKNIEYLTASLTGKHGTSCSIPKSDYNEWLKSQPVVLRDGKSLEDLNIYDNAFEFHELLQCENPNDLLDMICEGGELIVNGCNSSEEFRGSYESKMKHITEQLKTFKERLEVTIKSLRESHRRFKLEYIDDSFLKMVYIIQIK